jgi:hypothetical protein
LGSRFRQNSNKNLDDQEDDEDHEDDEDDEDHDAEDTQPQVREKN